MIRVEHQRLLGRTRRAFVEIARCRTALRASSRCASICSERRFCSDWRLVWNRFDAAPTTRREPARTVSRRLSGDAIGAAQRHAWTRASLPSGMRRRRSSARRRRSAPRGAAARRRDRSSSATDPDSGRRVLLERAREDLRDPAIESRQHARRAASAPRAESCASSDARRRETPLCRRAPRTSARRRRRCRSCGSTSPARICSGDM